MDNSKTKALLIKIYIKKLNKRFTFIYQLYYIKLFFTSR